MSVTGGRFPFATEIKGTRLRFFGDAIPFERHGFRFIECSCRVEELIVDDFPGNRLKSERLLFPPTFVFVAVFAERHDEIISREMFHAGSHPGEVSGVDVEFPVAGSILCRGEHWIGDETFVGKQTERFW